MIRYDTIRKRFTTAIYRRTIKWANMRARTRGTGAARRDGRRGGRETDAAGIFQYNTAGVKRDFQQHATQHM